MDADVVDDDDEVVVNILKTIATKCKKELQRGHVLLRSNVSVKTYGQNVIGTHTAVKFDPSTLHLGQLAA